MKKQYNGRHMLTMMIVVVALLVVAIALALVYKKSLPAEVKREAATLSAQSAKEQKSAVVMHETCAPREKLCFRYPKGWTVQTEEKEGGDLVLIQDAGKTMQLALDTGLAGVGTGRCESGEVSVARVVRSVETAIEVDEVQHEHTTKRIHAIALLQQDLQTKRYMVRLMLTTNKTAAVLGEHDGCKVHLAQFVGGRTVTLEGGDRGFVSFVSGKGVRDSASQVASVTFAKPEEAEKALSLRTYSQAFDILASAHYK